jgi:3-hydroxyisobutyrate dehydrogenase
MIAFLGTGLLGANFVRACLRRGEAVQVWNRTAAKARVLAVEGAHVCADPAAAARGAARIHLTLSDDAAVDDVLEEARPGFADGVIIVDHTTTSATGTRARAQRWAERGVAFQHAPLFMTPQHALEASGVMLASGERERFEALQPALEKMTGKLIYLGPQPERAAAFKLMGNLFIIEMTTGIAEMFFLGKALGIPAQEAATLFDLVKPQLTVPARIKRILDADFAHASFELAMARKDTRLMIEEAARGNVALNVLPAIAREMDRHIERGHANDDWTVIAKDALPDK